MLIPRCAWEIISPCKQTRTGSSPVYESAKKKQCWYSLTPGDENISNFTLKANETGLAGGSYLLTSLFGPSLNLELSANDQGSFDLKSDVEIPANQTIILELKLK